MPLSLSDLDGDYLMSSTTTDSFAVLLRRVAPELLPPTTVATSVPELLRHGRTVLAIRYNGESSLPLIWAPHWQDASVRPTSTVFSAPTTGALLASPGQPAWQGR